MTQLLGILICGALIAGLVYFDRDAGVRPSKALWIPVIWTLINGSRGVSTWLHAEPAESLAQQYSEGSPLDAAIYGLLILAGIMVLNHRARPVRQFLRENLPLIAFLGYCLLSVAWSEYPFTALKRWSKSVGDIVMVMLLITDAYPLYAVKRVFARVAFILLPCSVLFIWFIPSIGTGYSPEDNVMMYFGVTTFKNLLGMICMVFGLSSLWSFLGAFDNRAMPNRNRHMIAHAAIVAMAVLLIVRADSMTSLSCLFLAGAVMVLVSQPWIAHRPSRALLVVGGAIGLPLFALFINTMGTLVQSLGRNSTLTGRTSIWKAVLSLHTNPFIGTGFESFWLGSRLQAVWNMSVKGIQEAHNGFIELYINLGWIGLFLLGWLIVSGFRNGVIALRRDPHDGRLRLAFLTASLIFSLTEAGFHMLSPIWFAFLLAIAGNTAGLGPRAFSEPAATSRAAAGPARQIRVLQ
jgi:exopolysaccharide production protein ExoQ